MIDELFGAPAGAGETLAVLADDVGVQPVARVAFTDAPVVLGTKGRRKKVSAGVGLLFPEIMGV